MEAILTVDEDALPCDIEAERHVLGSCLLSTDAVAHAMELLEGEHFYAPAYGAIFDAVRALAEEKQPVSSATVLRWLDSHKNADGSMLELAGGQEVVIGAMEGVDPHHVEYWTGELVKRRTQRDLVRYAQEVRDIAMAPSADAASLHSAVYTSLFQYMGDDPNSEARPIGEDTQSLRDLFQRYVEAPDEVTGLQTGYTSLDMQLDGFRPGGVTTLYAPSSRMKSMFMTNVGVQLARNGYAGAWYTTEMPREQVQERIVQIEAGLNVRYLRKTGLIGDYRDSLDLAIDRVANYPIILNDAMPLEIGRLSAEVTRLTQSHHVEYVIIDLLDHVNSEKYENIDSTPAQQYIMQSAKALAKRTGTHIFLVSHISKLDRNLRNKAFLDPEDMKGSGSKMQDSDISIGVNPVKYGPIDDKGNFDWTALSKDELGYASSYAKPVVLGIYVAKNRNGETGPRFFECHLGQGGRCRELDEGEAAYNSSNSFYGRAPSPAS